jgi:hypothetical protein
MCAPAAIGIITAVTGVVGSIAGYQQQRAEVSYQNAVAQQQASYQNAVNKQQVDFQNAVARQQTDFSNQVALQQFAVQQAQFQASEQTFQQQVQLNNEAASRAYVAEQQKLNFEQKKAALEAQQFMVSAMQSQGSILASGRSGQSVGLMAADATREASRDLATLGLSLGYAYQDYYTGTQSIFNEAQSAQNIAQGNRMIEPMRPLMAQSVMAPDPIQTRALRAPGPSSLGLISGIAGAGLSGYSAYNSLKAPQGFVNPSPSPVPVPGAQLPDGRAGTVIRWS